ncbi:hypothetical protein BDFB_006591 [Asbolus verrucosus]|uniref:Uncharacterized protein n=1 Tax=Asbolus verrucosus TaxID=1661398 RepID=A0A482VE12_ASBVE|nr:hypothetical protein BDFB_006591 [Asbolus verrucosus]
MARLLSTPPPADIVTEVNPRPLCNDDGSTCSQNASPEAGLKKFDEDVSLNPTRWNHLEKEMVRRAEEMELEESLKLQKVLQNEEYRLLDELIYPLTKSGSKFLSVGVLPLKDFTPILRICNPC